MEKVIDFDIKSFCLCEYDEKISGSIVVYNNKITILLLVTFQNKAYKW